MSKERIQAIFEKDIKDFMKNSMLIFQPIVPIFLALFYSQLGFNEDNEQVLQIFVIIGLTLSSVTSGCIMTLMAEEKEKNTLRGLLLSPASFLDLIVGKSLVTAIFTFISLLISLIIIGITPLLNVQMLFGIILLFLFFLFLGISSGLFAKSVGVTIAYITPIMILFGLTPMILFLGLSENSLTMKIAYYFPVSQLLDMHDTHSWKAIFVVSVWMVLAGILTFFIFRRVQHD